MSIVSSTYVADAHVQKDGRRFVVESHTDSVGGIHTTHYLAPIGADYQALANARAATIAASLAEQEATEILNG